MNPNPFAIHVLGELLAAHSGQQLVESRWWRVEAMLQPVLRAHAIESIDRLAMLVARGGSKALRLAVVEALINHESSFFRDPPLFGRLMSFVETRLRAARAAGRCLRIWSAGCSTGQEAYSLAIAFAERPGLWDGWSIDILGTDVSAEAIDRARNGAYSQFEIQRGLPVRQMLRWFDNRDGGWHALPDLAHRVRFDVHNLLDGPPPGRFDVVLCRNVLLYFGAAMQVKVLGRLHDALAGDGVLMLGAAETALGATRLFGPDREASGLYRPAMRPGRSVAA